MRRKPPRSGPFSTIPAAFKLCLRRLSQPSRTHSGYSHTGSTLLIIPIHLQQGLEVGVVMEGVTRQR
jgi:hypothetical protein